MLNLAGIAIHGTSIGGLESCIQLPGLDLAFDIGRAPRSAVQRSRVFITHAHLDHMGGIAMHAATRSLTGLEPPTYVLPAEDVRDLEAVLAAWRRLDRSRIPCVIRGAAPGDVVPLRDDLQVRAFRTLHPVPSLGYGVWSRKRKLKEAYRDLPGDRIRDLRLAGEEVAEEVWTPDVACTGDTLVDVLDREPWLYEARLLVMEVTFLDDRVGVKETRSKGHVHLDEVLDRASRFHNQAILLTHFSARYAIHEIREILERRLPAGLRERVVPLLPHPRPLAPTPG